MKNTSKYILKLLIDFIKVDRVIHHNEIEFLKKQQFNLSITPELLNEANKITLEECIECLKNLPLEKREKIIDLIEELVSVDNDIHIKELFLLVACKLALGEETKASVQIISARATNIDFYSKQILYMENFRDERVNKYIKNLSVY